MQDALVNFFRNDLGIDPILVVFFISMIPILELRGGLIAAAVLGIDWYIAFPICLLGNMIPIPFILLFIRKIFEWLKKFRPFMKIIDKLEVRTKRKGEKVKKSRLWFLYVFVAIPLPGTGGWTGALLADIFDMRVKHSFWVIAAGVATAGVIILVLAYGLPEVFGFLLQ